MPRVCIHMDQDADQDYAKSFSGVGTDYALVCLACRSTPEAIEANLRPVSPERFARIEEEGFWGWDRGAILGRPEVLERPAGLSFRQEEVAPTGTIPGAVADLKPIPAAAGAETLILTDGGDLIRVDSDQGVARRLMNILDVGATLAPKLSLHVSPGGEMAAVVEARGRHGIVLDLEAGRPTMALDRGDYHEEQTDFPAVFFEAGGRLLLVHGTDWNRLEISDPRTGRTLTDRTSASYATGQGRPEHDLDYFHGSLSISPKGERIVDNGWVWHPAGVVVTWSLRRWVEENPWESEDGPTKRDLCARCYFWEGPLCWIDDRTLAVWGYGTDDENLIPAALIFDAESGQLVRWFAGPSGTFAFDRYLFSYSAEAGTSAWEVATGERVLHDPSFCPMAYHPGAGQFVTVTPGGGFLLSRLVGG